MFAAATVHGLTAGTDAGKPVSRLFAFGSIAAVALLTVLRVSSRASGAALGSVRRHPRGCRPPRWRRLRCARSKTRSRRSGVEQLAVAVWRAAGTSAGGSFARRSSVTGRPSPRTSTASSSSPSTSRSRDQGMYTREPDSDGLTANADALRDARSRTGPRSRRPPRTRRSLPARAPGRRVAGTESSGRRRTSAPGPTAPRHRV